MSSLYFQEKTAKRYFDYYPIDSPPSDIESYWGDCSWEKEQGATHIVRVSNGTPGTLPGGMSAFRCAKVLKTVAYIARTTDEFNCIVWDKWEIRQK